MSSRRGFTIVELLIVIVVIAILAAITIVAFNGVKGKAQDSDRLSDIALIKKAMNMYKTDNGGKVPICSGGNGSSCTLASISSSFAPTYISSVPNDPVPATYPYYYVGYNPASGDSQWSIRVYMNNTPNANCKAGENMIATWWSSAPECHN